ncbi:MAG: pilus (MSHA type) biogenesis protein MshL [Desulfobulbaceae bacterium]
MKRISSQRAICLLAFLLIFLASCAKQEATPSDSATNAPTEEVLTETRKNEETAQLPVRFQTPSYYTQDQQASDVLGEDTEDYEIKVGANISSTKGPQPLWDILKRVANLKGMTVSWASDVDQNVLVDVNINADDNFFDAIDNLLRQVDYYKEIKDNAIIVKYRETKRYSIAVPYMKGGYTTNVGGNFLAGREAATGTEGTVKVTSADNKFDVWENINTNLEKIVQEWRTQKTMQEEIIAKGSVEDLKTGDSDQKKKDEVEMAQQATRQISLGGSYFTIDKSVGLITVTAPRPLLEKVENYLETLKKELFRQVVIEAKIIEVYLQDNSKIGLDWSQVLKNFDLSGWVEFGTGGSLGQVWPWNPPTELKPDANYPSTYPGSMIYRVSMDAVPFNVMLNALNEQGEATVLSNPKVTVLNGQPAVINVGKDVTYIDSIEVEIDDETGDRTYSVETDSIVEGVALGVLASILDEDSVVMHLTPITTEIVGDTIEYRQVGFGEVGLPVVQIREMSTMVQVNNGEMLIIGGLIDSNDSQDESFAPVVGDIPLIKYLFGVEEKIKERRELVILLTPKII